MAKKDYHVIELWAENVLNLKAIRMRFNGKSAVITGDNEAGKSNVLNTIFMALTGDRYKPDKPIRDGQERGEIIVDLGDILVRKIYAQKGSRLEVENKLGSKFASPQALLNNIIGRMSFNPIEFARLSETAEGRRQQRKILIDMLGLNFPKTDEEISRLGEERITNTRVRKEKQSLLDAMPKPKDGIPEKELSISKELKKVEELESRRDQYLAAVEKVAVHKSEVETQESEVARLEMALVEAKDSLAKLKRATPKCPDTSEEVTEEEIRAAKKNLAQIDITNMHVREARQYTELFDDLQYVIDEGKRLDVEIDKLRDKKIKAIAKAEFPVKGLSFDEESVLYQGIPFSQQSTARQYMLATAICMELNPKLKVIMLRDASVISRKNLEAVCEMAEKRGYQVFVEKYDDSGKVGFYIEAGELKKINGKEVR